MSQDVTARILGRRSSSNPSDRTIWINLLADILGEGAPQSCWLIALESLAENALVVFELFVVLFVSLCMLWSRFAKVMFVDTFPNTDHSQIDWCSGWECYVSIDLSWVCQPWADGPSVSVWQSSNVTGHLDFEFEVGETMAIHDMQKAMASVCDTFPKYVRLKVGHRMLKNCDLVGHVMVSSAHFIISSKAFFLQIFASFFSSLDVVCPQAQVYCQAYSRGCQTPFETCQASCIGVAHQISASSRSRQAQTGSSAISACY